MRRITCSLLVFIMFLSFPIHASKIDSKKKELDNVKTAIEESKKELGLTAKEIEAVKKEIQELDRIIIEAENELYRINEELELKGEELKESEKELEKAIEEKEQQYEDAKERIESMYKNQKVGYLEIIFSSKDFWEMLNRMEYIRKIAEYDQILLDTMKENQERVEERTRQIEIEEQEISLLYKEQVGVKSRLDANKQEKDALLNKLNATEENLKSEIEDMDRLTDDLEGEIQELIRKNELAQQRAREQANSQGGTFEYTGGQLLWPVPGNSRISSSYGNRVHPIAGTAKFHTGIDIPAPFGKSVIASASGRVISAGWMNGYGNTVMIDHGGGLTTLYAHNSSLTVSNGDTVQKGDVVAKIGSTGYSTGNHCHFEVRQNGTHKNPLNYLR